MKLKFSFKNIFIFCVGFCLCAEPSFSANPAPKGGKVLFSGELEFSNAKIANAFYGKEGQIHISSKNLKAQENWAEYMEKLCKKLKCEVYEEYESKYAYMDEGDIYYDYYHPDYVVEYEDGFWYKITLDPAVIEIKVKPCTVEEIEKNLDRIQRDIFDVAKTLGLKPPKESGGHMHFGVESAFGEEVQSLADAVADLAWNHPELSMVTGEDFNNAPPMGLLSDEQQEEFVKVYDEVKKKKIRSQEDFARAMLTRVYHETYNPDMVNEYDPASKYHAVNVSRVKMKRLKARTVELRGLPVQQSANEYLGFAKLIQGRLNFLKSKKGNIKFEKIDLSNRGQLVSRYKKFVEESGSEWSFFKKLLDRKYAKAKVSPCHKSFLSSQ